jgi:hypothetical protein
MRIAGGVIALIGSVFGVIAALITLSIGGVGAAFNAHDAGTVVALGYGGVFFSFVGIVLGAVATGVRRRLPGMLLVVCALAGAILGGTFVAVCMLLVLIGGILAWIGGGKQAKLVPIIV